MRVEDEDMEKLRKRCGNTMYVAAAIYCTGGLRRFARMAQALTEPACTAHNDNERTIRESPRAPSLITRVRERVMRIGNAAG